MNQQDQVNAVQRMQAFIEANISRPVTLLELARAAGYSPWHCARIFREMTGKAPFEYIRALRLSRAALRLGGNPGRIIDVALDFVFDSHEGFTRAFAREFGLTPRDFLKNPRPVKLFMPPRISGNDFNSDQEVIPMTEKQKPGTVFVQVVERPARKLILRRGIRATDYYEYCEEVGCEIWDVLCNVRDALYEPAGLWLPPQMVTPGTSVYAQGVEVAADFAGEIPAGCELIDLPACKMMIFQGPPYDDEDFEQAITDLWAVMQDYRPETYGFRWADEDGPRIQLEPLGYRGYIEARPVRPV